MPSHLANGSMQRQRGAALLAVLLLGILITLGALVFSIGITTELKIAHNDLQGRQALSIAEAGISHALVAMAPSAADGLGMDEELGNSPSGGLASFGTQVAVAEDAMNFNYRCADFGGIAGSRYCVRAFDNFDETTVADAPADDSDDTIVVRSRGTVGSALRVVDAMFGIVTGPECALLTEGNLTLPGNMSVAGSKGCVHTNSGLTISGNPIIATGATASGAAYDVSGNPVMDGVSINTSTLKDQYEADHRNQAPQTIPSVRPMNFGPQALPLHEYVMNHPRGFRLDADTNIYVGPGFEGGSGVAPGGSAWTCVEASNPPDCSDGRALTSAEKVALGLDTWKHESKSWSPPAQWVSDKDYVVHGVFFVEGSVIVSKDWGVSGTPWRATIIALNSIQMPGKPVIAPYNQSQNPSGPGYVTISSSTAEWQLRNVLLVSGNDLEINGDAGNHNFTGGFFAHQQIKINGNPDIDGFLVAEDGLSTWLGDPAPNCTSGNDLLCMPGNTISGNPNITFDGMGTALFPDRLRRISWSDTR